MNLLGIDVRMKDAAALIRRLKPLKTTINVMDGGRYVYDENYSQVHLDTEWTEKDLDDWLYTVNNVDYVGTFTRRQNGNKVPRL